MKKYIFISLGSIASSIILIVVLYNNVDIPLVDQLVETTTKALGVTPNMVQEKIERREEIAQQKVVPIVIKEIDEPEIDPAQELALAQAQAAEKAKLKADSLAVVEKNKSEKNKKLFNAQVDEELAKKLENDRILAEQAKRISDSIALASKPKEEKKRKLFNASVQEPAPNSPTPNSGIVYMEAKVHGSQKFADNDVVSFRLTKPVTYAGITFPENMVFTTKANIFDGRIHFMLQKIDNTEVKGQCYDKGQEGIVISSAMKQGDNLILSDGSPITFGLKN